MTDIFDEIITNPAEWEDNGQLRIHRLVSPDGPQHNCRIRCDPGMCKGQELESYLARKGVDFDRIIYIGDGSNDFCPILKLRS
jgi:pyridoxal phosphate phosphatase PHOSPHO2